METENEMFTTKQYGNKQVRFPVDDLPKYEIRADANLFSASAPGPSQVDEIGLFENNDDETYRKRLFSEGEEYDGTMLEFNSNKCHYISPPRKKKRKKTSGEDFEVKYSSVSQPLEIPPEVLREIYSKATSSDSLQHGLDTRVDEVMKAARSLFSKRTRTLYHWLHPNAPKQQIKAAVSASWDSLGTQEKQFYVSQVLGRFGFPPCSLMINPQLGGIKELPRLPEMTDLNDVSANELRDAISSITIDGNNVFIAENEYVNLGGRRRRPGRPPGSKNKKHLANELRNVITQDFQDDPELNEELQQFAMNLSIP